MEFIKPSEQFDLKGFYLEITSKCNLRCLHCYNESGILKNEISFELFKRLAVRILQRRILKMKSRCF